ncbi:MAG: flagellar biosynthesis protein FliQ [Candidatus Lernaella stagnicola]|nr:flagellar biosynthesis protein FliQ [Candidatus Lernaella stagnicola]
MNIELLATIGSEAIWTAWEVASPVLLAGLAVGLVISVFQAVTQINEMTLTFIPKIIVAALAVAFSYDRMITVIVNFTERMFTEWGSFLQ